MAAMEIMRQVVVFDAADLGAESAFWAGVLDGRVIADDEDGWHSVLDARGRWTIGVQLAPGHEPPHWPNGTPGQQVHLDLHVQDPVGAHDRVMALGARLLEPGDLAADEGHQVYVDPAGHPFCIGWGRPDDDAIRERFARPLDPTVPAGDVVLPDAVTDHLRRIAERVRGSDEIRDGRVARAKTSRGHGLTVLFTGASGTGKTLAAEVLANQLGRDLHHVDLSALVGKYIGGIEQHLERLFDVAHDAGAILFFDEADALFGKRTEVKDSHDRYANLEVSHLLQRMEAFDGVSILCSSQHGLLDRPFRRWFAFVVSFPSSSA
ncbi:MAG TPA: AAA family ATPase [Nitriliruptoraceae bacterium]|nr:AAA family ATPase [Nitriliruptoraceae bacterium]